MKEFLMNYVSLLIFLLVNIEGYAQCSNPNIPCNPHCEPSSFTPAFNTSMSCQQNVNGAGYLNSSNERNNVNATVRILLNPNNSAGCSACTGVLLNYDNSDVSMDDRRQFLLTARHCVKDAIRDIDVGNTL